MLFKSCLKVFVNIEHLLEFTIKSFSILPSFSSQLPFAYFTYKTAKIFLCSPFLYSGIKITISQSFGIFLLYYIMFKSFQAANSPTIYILFNISGLTLSTPVDLAFCTLPVASFNSSWVIFSNSWHFF